MPETEGGSTFGGSTAAGSFPARPPASLASHRLAATLLCHPDLSRVGERAWLGAMGSHHPIHLSRLQPRFSQPSGVGPQKGAPLADRFLSREGLRLNWQTDGLEIDAAGYPHPLRLNGRPCDDKTRIETPLLGPGAVLEIADRVAILLQLVEPGGERVADLGLIGESESILELRRRVLRFAPTPWPVLLRGETGTGKELVARALHEASGRDGPFLAVNVAALPAELAAAELFGSRRGAFTGAGLDRRGLCLAAQGGTLFLDEIGAAPLELQAMLLRTLESGEILAVGSDRPQKIDVRWLAATDADLESAITAGTFRAPLLHRLSGLALEVPPLRARRDDIPRLWLHFLRHELGLLGQELVEAEVEAPAWLSPSLACRLVLYPWPGNVRELRNYARLCAVEGRGRTPVPGLPAGSAPAAPAAAGPGGALTRSGARHPEEMERREVLEALEQNRFEIKKTAAALGLSRNSFYALLERFGLPAGAGQLEAARIQEALQAAGNDVVVAAKALGVSTRALRRRLAELADKAAEP